MLFFIAFCLLTVGLASIFIRKCIKQNKTNNVSLPNNKYIRKHTAYLKDEKQYLRYLEWCAVNNQNPMDRKGFEDVRSRDKELDDIIKYLHS